MRLRWEPIPFAKRWFKILQGSFVTHILLSSFLLLCLSLLQQCCLMFWSRSHSASSCAEVALVSEGEFLFECSVCQCSVHLVFSTDTVVNTLMIYAINRCILTSYVMNSPWCRLGILTVSFIRSGKKEWSQLSRLLWYVLLWAGILMSIAHWPYSLLSLQWRQIPCGFLLSTS
jgi:hypothetical protein